MRRLIYSRLSGKTSNYHAAVTSLRTRQRSLPHGQDFYEFFLVTGGCGTHHLNGERQPLEPGSLGFVTPRDAHFYSADARGSLEFINVAFSAQWWKAFSSLFAAPEIAANARRGRAGMSRTSALTLPNYVLLDARVTRSLAEGMRALIGGSAHSTDALLRTCLALTQALRGGAAKAPAAPDLPDWLAELVAALADPQHISDHIHVWQERSGRSPEHLARMCRKHLGAPLSELLNRRRVEYAQQRLRDGSPKLAQLALEAGFQNLGYFYRVFKRLVGRTPRQWMRDFSASTVPR